MPYSRATTAPCDIIPPISITRAPAVRKRGVQPGSVEGATRISPGSSLAPAGERITRAIPETTPGEAGEPRSPSPTDTSAASASVPSESSKRGMRRRARVVAEAQVIRERAEDVLRVFGPALDADVDLADRSKAVTGEE